MLYSAVGPTVSSRPDTGVRRSAGGDYPLGNTRISNNFFVYQTARSSEKAGFTLYLIVEL